LFTQKAASIEQKTNLLKTKTKIKIHILQSSAIQVREIVVKLSSIQNVMLQIVALLKTLKQ
jgi:hypothetical protein